MRSSLGETFPTGFRTGPEKLGVRIVVKNAGKSFPEEGAQQASEEGPTARKDVPFGAATLVRIVEPQVQPLACSEDYVGFSGRRLRALLWATLFALVRAVCVAAGPAFGTVR